MKQPTTPPGRMSEKEAWEAWHQHFAIRLGQRYHMTITRDEYRALGSAPFQEINRNNRSNRLGIVIFKGQKIFVVKGSCRNRFRHLVTALPYDNILKYLKTPNT